MNGLKGGFWRPGNHKAVEVSLQAFQRQYIFDKEKDQLGKGAYGTTYRAYSVLRQKQVALKIYRGLDSSEIYPEIERAINLEHPNLIRYYNIYRVEGPEQMLACEMEYAEGGDFTAFLRGLPPPEELITLLCDILQGLDYLESELIIHRDIKLENILLAYSRKEARWVAKIGDFGLSKLINNAGILRTELNSAKASGTPSYLAPELLSDSFSAKSNDGKPIIRQNVDLWSFGVMVFYLFLKKPPFGRMADGVPMSELIRRILKEEPDGEALAAIPEPFRTVVKICLLKDATVRVASAADVLTIFRRKNITVKLLGKMASEPPTPMGREDTIRVGNISKKEPDFHIKIKKKNP